MELRMSVLFTLSYTSGVTNPMRPLMVSSYFFLYKNWRHRTVKATTSSGHHRLRLPTSFVQCSL